MNSNTSTLSGPGASPAGAPAGPGGLPAGPQGGLPAGLERLAAAVGEFAADDLDQLGDALLAAQVVALDRLAGQLDAVRLRLLAVVDARGAGGAEQGGCAPSTQAWLRAACRLSAAAAGQRVRTARALHRGPLAAHLRDVLDPDGGEERGRARLERQGLWLAGTFEGMVAVKGLLDAGAGEAAMAALAPLARPTGPDDQRSAAQRRADAFGELARQALQAGNLPQEGGLRPQLTVTADLASLLAEHGVGGVGGWGGVLLLETVRRLACDAAVTRAIVRRHPTHHDGAGDGGALAAALREAVALLPPPLGAPVELLDLGRATRVISPALRRALAVRDGGCAAPGCDRPPPWTDAHHRHHWLHGGPTSLDNLVLLCRTHHRAVHEHRWQLHHDPVSGRVTLAPPARRGHSPPAA